MEKKLLLQSPLTKSMFISVMSSHRFQQVEYPSALHWEKMVASQPLKVSNPWMTIRKLLHSKKNTVWKLNLEKRFWRVVQLRDERQLEALQCILSLVLNSLHNNLMGKIRSTLTTFTIVMTQKRSQFRHPHYR